MSHVLHLGDCLDGMAGLADRSVDHVICDPPYSRDLYARTRTNKGSGVRPNGRPTCRSDRGRDGQISAMKLKSLAIGAIDDILNDAAAQMLRISTRWILVFSDSEIAYRWRVAFGERYVRTGVWVKPDAMPQVSGDRPASGHETATLAYAPHRGMMRWNGGGRAAVWIENTCKGAERADHPCPKPLSLMERLIRDFTDPGELVCDPFAGSGTTGVACKRLGRNFVGWEKDPKFHAAAVRRIDAAREQFQLPRLQKAKQTGMVLHAPVAEATDANTERQGG